MEQSNSTLAFTIHPVQGDVRQVPVQRTYRIHLRGVEKKVTCSHPAAYHPDDRTLELEPVDLKPGEQFIVRFDLA
jgi:hypothetical protein